jgi:hypothetical protein
MLVFSEFPYPIPGAERHFVEIIKEPIKPQSFLNKFIESIK